MCKECGRTPCHPRCPNAEEKATSHVCFFCEEPILFGEEFLESEIGHTVHAECFSSMDRGDVFMFFGELEVVRTEDITYEN